MNKKIVIFLFFILIPLSHNLQAAGAAVNVSSYPSEIQEYYKLFENKCSTCHDLNKSINTKFVLPSYYKDLVDRMQQLPNSGFSQSEGNQIYEFLVFDAFERRKRLLSDQITPLPEEKKQQEKDKLREIINKYKKKS